MEEYEFHWEGDIPEQDDLPEDYEPCGDCGFDHGYEQDEAVRAHNN